MMVLSTFLADRKQIRLVEFSDDEVVENLVRRGALLRVIIPNLLRGAAFESPNAVDD